jgi:hypothetical protein
VTTVYNVWHYQIEPDHWRSRDYFVLEILNTNIMILLTFYYLKMASEHLLTKSQYKTLKRSLIVVYVFCMVYMTYCGIKLQEKVISGEVSWDQMCGDLLYDALRWGPAFVSVLFLAMAFFIHDMIRKQFKKNRESIEVMSARANEIKTIDDIFVDQKVRIHKAKAAYLNEKEEIMSTSLLEIKGEHNIKNAMAAATAAHLLKIRKKTIREKLSTFQGVEHRLETVLKINNVTYINDSKATNINATHYALDAVSAGTVWIVGGVDKGNDYSELLSLVNEKVKAIICLGVDNKKIVENFKDCLEDIYETTSMEKCVKIAYHLAEPGDTVLLSPACASFDLFKNYEDRGNQFKNAIRNL